MRGQSFSVDSDTNGGLSLHDIELMQDIHDVAGSFSVCDWGQNNSILCLIARSNPAAIAGQSSQSVPELPQQVT